jgi:negative regulator of sigma E activity
LTERETKLQQLIDNETKLLVRQSELERDLKLLEQTNFELKSAEQSFIEQLQQTNPEQMNFDLQKIAQERDSAIAEKNQLENELTSTRQKVRRVSLPYCYSTKHLTLLFSCCNSKNANENMPMRSNDCVHIF